MPKENKKRGRRADKKRRLEEAENIEEEPNKRQRQESEHTVANADFVAIDGIEVEGEEDAYNGPGERPFYGLLDEEEAEYFRKAGEVLDLNQFPDAHERNAFVESVYREAEGKELKIANSQSCSRLFERLLRLSTASQLKKVFKTFKENFVPLVQHRFASHCCETLFLSSAPVVTTEIENPPFTINESEPEPKMEDLFLEVVQELKDQLGWLMTDIFACHPLRVLLLVLSGQPIAQQPGKSGLHSKRKEHNQLDEDPNAIVLAAERNTPASFAAALESLLTACVVGLDTNSLRSLASHRTGNPTLQLLLRLELTQFGKARGKDESSIVRLLIPEETITADSQSSSFVVGLMYDPVGSRLLETIIEHAPAKLFKSIYRGFMRPKLESLVKNDKAAYVVSRAIVRLGREDLQEAITILAPSIPSLVERNRLAIIRTLIDHAVYREANTEAIARQLSDVYSGPNGFDINRLLQPSPAHEPSIHIQPSSTNSNEKLHASLLAQSMLNSPAPLSSLILDALTTVPSSQLILLAQDIHTSHTVVSALTSTHSPVISRRKLIAALYGHIAILATHQCASRVIDALWSGTRGLAFMRERVAEELAEAESVLREAHYGKRVWRNWKMDLYRRRRREWVAFAKSSDDIAGNEETFVGFPTVEADATTSVEPAIAKTRVIAAPTMVSGGNQKTVGFAQGEKAKKHMTALEKARERHAVNKARRERTSVGFGVAGPNATGANASTSSAAAKAVVT